MEDVSLPMLPQGAFPVVEIATFTVPTDTKLHLTHAWAAAGGSVVADAIIHDGDTTPGTRTILGGAGTLSALDLWVKAGDKVTIAGTAGFVGYLMPAIP